MIIPYNVDIHFDDFCKGCNICEIDISETEHIGSPPYFGSLQIYHIRCRNQEVCKMWRDKMRGDADADGYKDALRDISGGNNG